MYDTLPDIQTNMELVKTTYPCPFEFHTKYIIKLSPDADRYQGEDETTTTPPQYNRKHPCTSGNMNKTTCTKIYLLQGNSEIAPIPRILHNIHTYLSNMPACKLSSSA